MDEEYLRQAIGLAEGRQTHPNPRVGSVIVKDGRVIAEGYHRGPGTAHAEADALARAGGTAEGSTVYVTLEPCSFFGRTPPCADALVAAKVAKVVIATGDPDPNVSGAGLAILRDAGIEVVTGVLEAEAIALDPGYFHHRRTGRPRVTIKAAMTLDGNTAAADHTSQWITSPESRTDAHTLRSTMDAILIGAGTLRDDDPALTVRIDGYEGPQPRPVVVAGSQPLPASAQIFGRNPVVLSATEIETTGELVVVPTSDGRVDLAAAMQILGEMGIVDLLVEGGAGMIGELSHANLVDRGVLYIGAKFGGGSGIGVSSGLFSTLGDASDMSITDVAKIGPDVRIEFERA